MKIIYLIFILAATANFVFANEIDNLQTNKEVNKFLAENVLRKDTDIVVLNESKANPAPYGKNKFYKLDLDNNGLTDLIVDGKYFLVVTDEGNKKYNLYPIDRGAFSLDKYTLTDITPNEKNPVLVVRSFIEDLKNQESENGKVGGKETEKNLIFKFDGFVEYNSKPDNLKIQKIKFSTSGCFGSCPIFELEIQPNKNATYNAINYNDLKGKFKGSVDAESYDKIVQTLNYINFLTLKDEYTVPWTDDQTSVLEVTFDNGKTKKISDYGMIGTFGLENLYNQLFILRKTQKWTK